MTTMIATASNNVHNSAPSNANDVNTNTVNARHGVYPNAYGFGKMCNLLGTRNFTEKMLIQ